MKHAGVLQKMQAVLNNPIQYYQHLNDDVIHVNRLIGLDIQIEHTGQQCLCCGGRRKIYRQGFCYNCFFESPARGEWIIRPELSKAHLGIEDRHLDFEREMQLQPHIVYLAFSGDVKVGVTRKSQVPTRWIDQGATAALPILETPNRYLAGVAEVALKQHLSDKINWRKMLKDEEPTVNLHELKEQLSPWLPPDVTPYLTTDQSVLKFNYPVEQYPEKVKSLNLEKTPRHAGRLAGAKGQYLIFYDGTVFNIRGNEGMVVSIEY